MHLVVLPELSHVDVLGLTHIACGHAVTLDGTDAQTDGGVPGQLFTTHKHLADKAHLEKPVIAHGSQVLAIVPKTDLKRTSKLYSKLTQGPFLRCMKDVFLCQLLTK